MTECVDQPGRVLRRVWVTERPGEGNIVVSTPQLALPLDTNVQGDLVTYRIRLPFLPPSKNAYDGWLPEWKAGCKRKWVKAVVRECEALQIPRAPRIGLAAMLVFSRNGRRDPQNYANCLWNFVPDALQHAGVIADDRDGVIDFGPNLGIRFAINPAAGKGVTHLTITMVVPSHG